MKNLVRIILIITTCSNVWAQGEFSLYNLNKTVPQAHQLNPAFHPQSKVVIGLPVLSSTHLSVDMDQLSFNQVFTKNFDQTLSLNAESISSALRDKNNFSVKSDIQLFFLGLNFGKSFFSLAFNDRINNWMVYNKDFANLIMFGNGDDRTFGHNLSLDHMMARQNLYHELALGFSTTMFNKLGIGARIKILSGVVNAQTDKVSGYLRTDADSIYMTNTNFAFRNSGYDYLSGNPDILSFYRNSLPFVGGNTGLAFDFGLSYQLTEKINLSAAVTDLGYINWKENTQAFVFDNVTYAFRGFDVIDLLNDNGTNNDFIQQEVDSLNALFTPTEQTNVQYKSSLTSNFNMGMDYQLGKKHHVGGQVYGKIANGNVTPEFGVYYNLQLSKVVNAVVNASYRNGQIQAAGMGASIDLGPFQVYATTESVTSLVNQESARMLDARVGVNLVFGRNKKHKKEELLAADSLENIPSTDTLAIAKKELPSAAPTANFVASNTEQAPAMPATINKVEVPEVTYVPAIEPTKPEIIKPSDPIKKAPKIVVVKQGNHKDELALGNYVVVGAFLSKANAQKYSDNLKKQGYDNQYGFLTEKAYYYVTIYKNSDDVEKARAVRNEYRQKEGFLFSDTWLLRVVK